MKSWIAQVVVLSLAVVFGAGAIAVATSATADPGSTPPAFQQRTPNMVTADALPTVQIDSGVVWTTLIVGNTVYAGGQFTNTRPAGAAAGTNLTPRSNLLAFNLTTGNLTSFAPTFNGAVKSLAVSPDGSTLYVGGAFNSVNGTTHYNLAAFNTATGALNTSFSAQIGGSYVNAIAATSTTVYVGGLIGAADGTTRKNLAAVTTAGKLVNWAPTTDLQVDAMVLTPKKDKLIIGGRFGQVNGVTQRGLAALSLTDGSMLPWLAPQTVIDGGAPTPSDPSYGKAGIYSLSTDGNAIYGTGWVFADASIGNLEGSFSANPDTGALNWLEDCHGDTYSAYSDGTDVYEVSHKHDCSSIGAYPNATPAPGNLTHMEAFTASVQGTLTHPDEVNSIYDDWAGEPAPAMVNFFPQFVTGSFTGQGQAAWTLAGNGQYVVAGGEFPYVNGQLQQGLVRFAVKPISGAKVGPHLSGTHWVPTAISIAAGTARVAIPQNYDYDDLNLTYNIMRKGTVAPVYTTTVASPFWQQSPIIFTDKGLTPGHTYEYQVIAVDGDGNQAKSSAVDVTVSTQAISPYAQAVINDGSSLYWRLSGSGATAGIDWAGTNDGAVGTGVTPAAGGAIAGDTNGASTFNGTANGLVATQASIAPPAAFSLEFWIRTTSTTGGKIIGYGSSASGDSGSYDRHVYMTNNGQLFFGVYPGGVQTVSSSASYNDGNWHYVVASQGSGGIALYVDGKRVGLNSSVTSAQSYAGYWRVGGDNLNGWPNQPTNEDFTGDIDDVSIYPSALSLVQVDTHYQLAGGTITVPIAPADAYGAAVFNSNPELYWRLDDAVGASTAADSSPYGVTGSVQGGTTFGQTGIQAPGTAALFDGSSGVVVSTQAVTNPTVYTEEAWFKTTTTTGGKIIGFGNAASGLSNNYDRHTYMQDNGQLVFGTWTGQTNTITSPQSYNDGSWHQVVATQGSDGMSLYVDGSLVGTNPQTAAQPYTGYWRVGGDPTWSSSSPYFAGTIDEAAVFDHELSASDVSTEYQLGSGVTVPTAAFSAQANQLAVTFSSSGSQAFNGATITGYSWDFGDGTSSTVANPTHTYATPNDYQVTLTVTDSGNHTGSTTKTVTVTQHLAPTANIQVNPSGLSASFDGTGSTATDGATIQSYAWTFGDGGTSSSATPSHTYATAGPYTVTLTVTDSLGAVSTPVSTPVNATHAAPVAAFTATPGSNFSLGVNASASTASDGATLSYSWNWGDGTAAGSGVTASHTYTPGSYTVTLTVTDSLGAVSTPVSTLVNLTHAAPVAAFNATPGSNFSLGVNASASTASDGATLSYSWNWGDGTAAGSGVTASHTYAIGGSYTVTLTVTDSLGAVSTPVSTLVNLSHAAPVAAFTATPGANLSLGVNASASTASDGATLSYSWNWGDGTAAGSGVTASHTYAVGGSYTVTLTLNDSLGGTATTGKSVTVQSAIATDTFTRTVASNWGTADVGGAWTNVAGTSVGNGVGLASIPAGSTRNLYLGSVSAQEVDATLQVALDRLPTAGLATYNVLLRSTAAGDYRAKVTVGATGSVTVYLGKYVGTTETILSTKNLAGYTYTPGTYIDVRFQVMTNGSSSTLRTMVWPDNTTVPTTWLLTSTDSQAELQVPGRIGLSLYVSKTVSNGPVALTFDNLQAVKP
jgi:PKD repeat protein